MEQRFIINIKDKLDYDLFCLSSKRVYLTETCAPPAKVRDGKQPSSLAKISINQETDQSNTMHVRLNHFVPVELKFGST